jgi:hypothetical protein
MGYQQQQVHSNQQHQATMHAGGMQHSAAMQHPGTMTAAQQQQQRVYQQQQQAQRAAGQQPNPALQGRQPPGIVPARPPAGRGQNVPAVVPPPPVPPSPTAPMAQQARQPAGAGFGRGAPVNPGAIRAASSFQPGQGLPQAAQSSAQSAPPAPPQPVDFEFLPLICDIMRLVEEGYASNADIVRCDRVLPQIT